MKLHFQTKHSIFPHHLLKQEQQKKSSDLSRRLKQLQTVLLRNVTKASFALANQIAKQNKSFVEAELIKIAWLTLSLLYPDVNSKVYVISLSRRTILRRIEAIDVNVY